MRSLSTLAPVLLDPQRPAHRIWQDLHAFRALLEAAQTGWQRADSIERGETYTDHGLAVSPTMAARCLDETKRTIQFMRGLHAAIAAARGKCPDRPVRVLYAGCGPYATLALPQMAVFSPAEVAFTLLDLHAASIASAQATVAVLGLQDHVARFEQADAATYRLDPEAPPDVMVMEVMQASLAKEPQVAVTRHLSRQAPEALLVPEEIRVDLTLIDRSREFVYAEAGGVLVPTQRDRIPVGTLFVLSRASAAAWAAPAEDRLPAATVHLPHALPARYEPMLCTVIRTFGDHVLRDYDSSLTYPQVLPVEGGLREGGALVFHYELGSQPGLRGTWQVLAS